MQNLQKECPALSGLVNRSLHCYPGLQPGLLCVALSELKEKIAVNKNKKNIVQSRWRYGRFDHAIRRKEDCIVANLPYREGSQKD
jgi:hypothetical protein